MPRGRRIVAHRRVREKKTNYRQRLKLLKSGESRLVVRRANKNMLCQIVDFDKKGDATIVSASSNELSTFGWNANTGNIPAAYLTGLLIGVRAKAAGKDKAIFDIGLFEGLRGSRMFSVLKGAVDAGLDIPHSEKAFPSEERLTGSHIAGYAAELKKNNKEKYDKYFSAYIKAKIDPESIAKLFEETKKKILADGTKPKKDKKPEKAAVKASAKPKAVSKE